MKRLLVAVTLSLIAACSGDNGTAPGGNNGGGEAVTHADTVWVQDMEAFADQLQQWDGESRDTIAARALAYLQALPSVVHAGITDGTTVWANFANGFDLVVPNNRNTSSEGDTLVDQASPVSPPNAETPRRITIPSGRRTTSAVSVPTSALELPEVATFRAINAIGTCHINPLPGIRSLLKAGNYTEDSPGRGTVSRLKTVNGDGVFYLNSHGGPGFDRNSQPYYAVWTEDSVSVATLGNYRGMVNRHELVGMVETSNDAQGNCVKVMHYGFTGQFVRKYMTFPKNALVVIDACSSVSGPSADLRDAFKFKGASAYVGWSSSVDAAFAYAAMKYLIDRLLGINKISPESPKQRAFNIDDVRQDMATNRHLVNDPNTSAVLTVSKLKDDFGLLSPSIQFLSLEEEDDRTVLVIAGIFGTDPGAGKRQVTINEQPLDVIDWQPTLIRADIPETGSSASGTVVVEVGEGANPRRSNPVNLTEWEGTLVYDRDDPGDLSVNMNINVHFRADIHPFRDLPGEQPFETTVLFSAMHDASVAITTSGSYVDTQGAPCVNTFTFSHSVNLASPYDTSPEGGWTYFGSVDSRSHTLQLNLNVGTLSNVGSWVRSGPTECGTATVPLIGALKIDDCLFDDLTGVKAFRMQMGTDYDVTADTRGPCSVHPLVTYLDALGLQAQASMHWGEMATFFPPDPEAAR